MSQGYVPGLLQRAEAFYRKRRELPLPGKTLVAVGDKVASDTVVLEAELPGDIAICNLVRETGFESSEIAKCITFSVGQQINKGDLLCSIPYFFHLFSAKAVASTSGQIEFYTELNGHVGIRQAAKPLTISAYVPGTIVNIEAGKSVEIEGVGAFIQGIFGVGGERSGRIYVIPVANDAAVTINDLKVLGAALHGTILVGGATYTTEALTQAAALGVQAIVTGSIDSKTLSAFVGFEIGVSMTGDEDVPLSLIVTEGFGRLGIAQRVIDIATPLHGRVASVSGATQVRAGAMRPELIIPLSHGSSSQEAASTGSVLAVGSTVRALRDPLFGKLGIVRHLPSEPQRIATGAVVRVAEVEIDSSVHQIPRANLELVIAS